MKIIKKIFYINLPLAVFSASFFVFPILTFAVEDAIAPASFCPGDTKSIRGILNFFTCLITESVMPLLISIAVIIFIWGVIQYVINANDQTKREEGRNFIIWGIIGLFVIVSIWGIIKLLTGTFGFTFAIPQLQQ